MATPPSSLTTNAWAPCTSDLPSDLFGANTLVTITPVDAPADTYQFSWTNGAQVDCTMDLLFHPNDNPLAFTGSGNGVTINGPAPAITNLYVTVIQNGDNWDGSLSKRASGGGSPCTGNTGTFTAQATTTGSGNYGGYEASQGSPADQPAAAGA